VQQFGWGVALGFFGGSLLFGLFALLSTARKQPATVLKILDGRTAAGEKERVELTADATKQKEKIDAASDDDLAKTANDLLSRPPDA